MSTRFRELQAKPLSDERLRGIRSAAEYLYDSGDKTLAIDPVEAASMAQEIRRLRSWQSSAIGFQYQKEEA